MEREGEITNDREDALNMRNSASAANSTEIENNSFSEYSIKSEPHISFGSLADDVLLDNQTEDDDANLYNSNSAILYRATASEMELFENAMSADHGRLYGQTFSMRRCLTPPVTALFGCSGASKKGLQCQSIQRTQCSSVRFVTFSSATSDRTMVDHGISVDHVRVQTPDLPSNTRKGVMQTHFPMSTKGEGCLSFWKKKVCHRKLPFNENHLRSSTGSSVSVCSGGVGGNVKMCIRGGRSSSCPVNFVEVDIPCNSHVHRARSLSCPSSDYFIPSVFSTGCSTGVALQLSSDGLCQYRLAVQNAKKGRYGLSIREILAGHGDVDEDEENQEDLVAISES